MNDKAQEQERIANQLRDAAAAAVEAMIQARTAGSIADGIEDTGISDRAARIYAGAMTDLEMAIDALADLGRRFSGAPRETEADDARRIEAEATRTQRDAAAIRKEAEAAAEAATI